MSSINNLNLSAKDIYKITFTQKSKDKNIKYQLQYKTIDDQGYTEAEIKEGDDDIIIGSYTK